MTLNGFLGGAGLVAAIVLGLLVCKALIRLASWFNPLGTIGVILLSLVLVAVIGVRVSVDHREVEVVSAAGRLKAGHLIAKSDVKLLGVERQHAHGRLRDVKDAIGRTVRRTVAKHATLTPRDVQGVAPAHRAFAIEVDDNVTLSETFATGSTVDLAFAAAEGVPVSLVPKVRVVEMKSNPSVLVVSLDAGQTTAVLGHLGRGHLTVTAGAN